MDLSILNENQRLAVLQHEGPVLVVAGAGSGKTRVLTYRIASLIDAGVKPFEILAITFTNKASKEMKERVIDIVGPVAYDVTISTFHSFGARLLRREIEVLGYTKSFTIFDSSDQLAIIKHILKRMNMDPKRYPPKMIAGRISQLKNDGIKASTYLNLVETDMDTTMAKIYKKYEEELLNNNAVDFDDLLILPLEILNNYPEILAKYQRYYRYLLVDEYQDTNHLQYSLIKLLSKVSQNIFVVGDSDQSIYSWRGADISNILNFEKDFENAKVIMLEQNYRSTQNILQAANNVIAFNKNRKDKHLFSELGDGELISYERYYSETEEAQGIIDQIHKLKKQGYNYKDMAVLYRTNAQSRVFEDVLLKENLPYQIIGSYYFYARREIKDLMSYLRLIVNPQDDISLTRIINTPKRGIGDTTLDKLSAYAFEKEISMFQAIDDNILSNSSNLKLQEFKSLINHLISYASNESLINIIEEVLDKSGYKQMLSLENTLESKLRLEYLDEFKSVARSFMEKFEEIDIETFLEEISLVADMKQHEEVENSLTLMTLHSAKGLEFDFVFLAGMEENLFPHANSLGENDDVEEERRLCYVGITRAKKSLYLSSAKLRISFGVKKMHDESRFISEIGTDLLDSNVTVNEAYVFDSARYSEEQVNNFGDGQKVRHPRFGEGVIVKTTEDTIFVAFAQPHGVKPLSAFYNSLEEM